MNARELVEQMINIMPDYVNTLTHKAITWIGGMSSVVYFSQVVQEHSPNWLISLWAWLPDLGFTDILFDFFQWLSTIDFMQMLSTYAIILLCIERTYIVWAWRQRKKRGDYDEGNPGRTPRKQKAKK